MKKILNEWRQFLNESSLSRLYRHMMAHDTAIITAYRGDPNDDSNCVDKSQVTDDSSNKLRNRDLKATLMSLGYGVTSVDGSYIENFNTPEAYEVAEHSFFVVNLEDDPDFAKYIVDLGDEFCQDAVLIIPKGGQGAYLHGTNNSEFPGYGQKVPAGDLSFGKEKEFMTKVRGRPVAFTEELETYKKLSRMERMSARAIAKTILKN